MCNIHLIAILPNLKTCTTVHVVNGDRLENEDFMPYPKQYHCSMYGFGCRTVCSLFMGPNCFLTSSNSLIGAYSIKKTNILLWHKTMIKSNISNPRNLACKYIDYTWAHNEACMMKYSRDFSSRWWWEFNRTLYWETWILPLQPSRHELGLNYNSCRSLAIHNLNITSEIVSDT